MSCVMTMAKVLSDKPSLALCPLTWAFIQSNDICCIEGVTVTNIMRPPLMIPDRQYQAAPREFSECLITVLTVLTAITVVINNVVKYRVTVARARGH